MSDQCLQRATRAVQRVKSCQVVFLSPLSIQAPDIAMFHHVSTEFEQRIMVSVVLCYTAAGATSLARKHAAMASLQLILSVTVTSIIIIPNV